MQKPWIGLALLTVAACSSYEEAYVPPRPENSAPAQQPTAPFASTEPPAFYTQRVERDGLLFVGSPRVLPEAFEEAAWLARHMTAYRPELRERLAEKKDVYFPILAASDDTTDLPENADLWPAPWWNWRARGFGGSETFAPEEDLLEFEGNDRHTSIFVHELAHTIHLSALDKDFDARVHAAYDAAMQAGRFKGVYAATNHMEYWACGSDSWFDDGRAILEKNWPEAIDHRAEVKTYDPALATLLAEVYGDEEWRWTPASARTGTEHLVGFDPSAHKFTPVPHPDIASDPAYPPLARDATPWVRASSFQAGTAYVYIKNQTEETVRVELVDASGTRGLYLPFGPGGEIATGFTKGTVVVLTNPGGTTTATYVANANGKIVIR